MTRTERIARSRQISEASDVIATHGTDTQRAYRAAHLARGRFSSVLTLAAAILPQSAYALSA